MKIKADDEQPADTRGSRDDDGLEGEDPRPKMGDGDDENGDEGGDQEASESVDRETESSPSGADEDVEDSATESDSQQEDVGESGPASRMAGSPPEQQAPTDGDGGEVEENSDDGSSSSSDLGSITGESDEKKAKADDAHKKHMTFEQRQEQLNKMRAAAKNFDVNMESVIAKWKRVRQEFVRTKANSVLTSGNDGSLMIARRLTEIGSMCSTTTRADFFISTLSPRIQATIRHLTSLSTADFTRARRQNWTPFEYVEYAARMTRIIAQACMVRRKLIPERKDCKIMTDKDVVTCAIGRNVRDCMMYKPEFRTKEMRQKILWYLRTSKAFSHLFSSEMEEECTKFVFYEKYQDGRILAYSGRKPEKFYYVISGKIEKRRTYELRAGDFHRVFETLTKGETSSADEVEHQKPRRHTWSAKGITEVLTLDKDAFFGLLRGTGGLPLNFLQTISIFQEFPCERFHQSPDAILTRYFPKDRVILQDVSDTPWIHLIKSGSAKVVRKQLVFDYPVNKYHSHREIGYGKASSHSNAMLGITYRQRQCKAAKEARKLPPIQQSFTMQNPFSFTLGVDEMVDDDDYTSLASGFTGRTASCLDGTGGVEAQTPTADRTSQKREVEDRSLAKRLRRPVNVLTREIKIPIRSSVSFGSSWRPSSRRQQAKVLLGPDGFPPKRPQREAYVVVDRLRSGDFLGFQNITALIENEKVVKTKENPLTLISDGAEMILVSKRFFVQHAANNTMLKAETLSREFSTPEEASSSMDAKADWEMFKTAFLRRMAANTRRQRTSLT